MRYIRRNRRLDACVMRTALATVLGLLGLSAAPTCARASSEAWHAHAESVLELLQADTRRALDSLAAGRLQSATSTPASTPGVADGAAPARAAPDELELAALYGTAGRFTAVVYVNGVRKEYRPGATLPYAGRGAAREYRLIRIVDSCVLLKRQNARQTRSACFNPARQQDAVPLHADRRVLAGGEAASLGMPLPGPGIPGSER
jgi:hypothetical protein